MKKLILALLMIFVTLSAFASTDESTLFLWKKTDPAVNYFRYKIDDEEWIVVGTEQRDAVVSTTKDGDHYFSIAQSYDGVNWGETVNVHYSFKPEDKLNDGKGLFSRFDSSLTFVPFETYIAQRDHVYGREYRSAYAAGLEMDSVVYLGKNFGLGVLGEGTFAYIGAYSRNISLNWSAYGIAAFRLIAHEKFSFDTKVGGGVQFESINGEFYMSPSALLQFDASVKFFENLALSISPSLSVSFSDFDLDSDYLAYNIRAIAVGLKYIV